jgi:acetoin utilization deacetylase AcuC-like enzyme
MTRALVEGVPSAEGKVVLALEGGYKLSVLSQCVEACVEALFVDKNDEEEEPGKKKCPRLEIAEEEEEEEQEGEEAIAPAAGEAIARALELHRPFWPCLRE